VYARVLSNRFFATETCLRIDENGVKLLEFKNIKHWVILSFRTGVRLGLTRVSFDSLRDNTALV